MKLPIPKTYAPMEARPASELPKGPDWHYEPKWDGFRCLAFRNGKRVDLESKSGKPLTRYFPELVRALAVVPTEQFVLDGEGSIAEMAEAGAERGYHYIAITDHSKGLKIAGGIDEQQLASQGDEIDGVSESLRRSKRRLKVLRSVELNLNPRGEGDMDSRALAKLDLVLGCFHSGLRKKEDQTERYLAALRNPDIQILGHPRGRIYNHRVGLTADWKRAFELAAELDKAVEIDCYPDRQDLNRI